MLSKAINTILACGAIGILAVVGTFFTLFAMQPPAHFLLWFAIPIDMIYAGLILFVLVDIFGKRV